MKPHLATSYGNPIRELLDMVEYGTNIWLKRGGCASSRGLQEWIPLTPERKQAIIEDYRRNALHLPGGRRGQQKPVIQAIAARHGVCYSTVCRLTLHLRKAA